MRYTAKLFVSPIFKAEVDLFSKPRLILPPVFSIELPDSLPFLHQNYALALPFA